MLPPEILPTSNIVYYYSSLISYKQKNSMQSTLFWQPYSLSSTDKPLYQSKAILQTTGTHYDVVITKDYIRFHGMYLPYSFDLKFGIRQGAIYFEQEHQSMQFLLPNKDEKAWRDVLKLYLNQKGFHQTFKAIKKIGKGNFASVYLVQKIQNKCRYAVKAFSKEAAYSEQNGKECLIKEIQIMRHLEHPHLMKLKQVFESDNSLYIVFELIEGGQLYDKIKGKYQFTQSETKNMMRGLLEGLQQMHSKNIMHRDIKPENILIRSKDSLDLVIADFGLSEFASNDNYLFVRCGTPGYVAPEVINIKDMKKKYSTICDVFSVGIIFHIFLFGQSIFRKKTYNEVLAQNRSCSFTFQDQMYSKIQKQTLDLLKKMLRVNPEERISAEQALDHPYFKSTVDEFQLPKISSKISNASTDLCPSPDMGKNKLDKDSCVDFVMGKGNVVVGKTDTIAQVAKTNVSVFGKGLAGRTSKISKFSTKPAGSI